MYTNISCVHMELFRRRRRPARFIGVMSYAAQGAFLFLFCSLTFVLRFSIVYIYICKRLTWRAANRYNIYVQYISV